MVDVHFAGFFQPFSHEVAFVWVAALVEALGKAGEADKAVEMVKDMGQRGFVDCAGVYYALACTLCTVGRWSEALLQVLIKCLC
jgi:pentatricopeptide repeat protein